MPLFTSVPAVSTQKDTTKPMNKRPANKVTQKDFEIKKPLTEEEKDELLKDTIKELEEEAPEPLYFEDDELPKEEIKKEEPVKEEPKKVLKQEPKKEEPKDPKGKPKVILKQEPKVKEEPKKEEPKKEEAKPKPLVKEEKKEMKPEVKKEEKVEEVKQEADRPLTEAEKKAKQMENLRKARLARQAQQTKENEDMAAQKTTTKTTTEKPKKLVTEPKKAVDMSKMVMTTKKPAQATNGKTVYHVSKRGETREDRVWKVFIQESNKVIKLFDYQEEALEYAKQLAKNKNDGSYVILHGLNGKIRKY